MVVHRHHGKRNIVFSRGQRKYRRRLCIALNRVEGLSSNDKKKEHQCINKTILFRAKYDLPSVKPKQKKLLVTPPPKPAPPVQSRPKPTVSERERLTRRVPGCTCPLCTP